MTTPDPFYGAYDKVSPETIQVYGGSLGSYIDKLVIDEVKISNFPDEPKTMFRFNQGKVPLTLVPTSLTKYAAYGLWYGAIKYEANNWRKAGPWTKVGDSFQRHWDAWKDGEDYDVESGLPHLAHLACNLAFLIEFFDKGLGTDDRFRYTEQLSGRDLKFNEPAQRQLP